MKAGHNPNPVQNNKLQYIVLTLVIVLTVFVLWYVGYVCKTIGTFTFNTLNIYLIERQQDIIEKQTYLPYIPDKVQEQSVLALVESHPAPVITPITAPEPKLVVIEEVLEVIEPVMETVPTVLALSTLEQEINEIRIAHNLQPLQATSCLRNASHTRAQEMVDNNYFSHARQDGSRFWTDLWCDFGNRGENLAKLLIEDAPSNWMVDSWMNSPTHKAVILDPSFTHIGISTVDNITAMEVGF